MKRMTLNLQLALILALAMIASLLAIVAVDRVNGGVKTDQMAAQK